MRADGENVHRWPQGLPGGRSILFSSAGAGAGDEGDIVVQSLETGERRIVHRGGSHARYLASGHLVFVRNATLFAAPFDLSALALTGEPVAIVSGVSSNAVEGTPQYAVSESGVLAYLASRATPENGPANPLAGRCRPDLFSSFRNCCPGACLGSHTTDGGWQ